MKYEEYNSLLMDYAKAICYICDLKSYKMLHISKAGMEMCGLNRPEDYLGKKCYEILHGTNEPCLFCPNFKLKEGEIHQIEHYNEKLDKWFLINDSVVNIDGNICHIHIAQDIDEIKKKLEKLSNKVHLEDFLLKGVSTLTNEKDIDTAINTFLKMVGHYYNADMAYIYKLDPKDKTVNGTLEWYKDDSLAANEDFYNSFSLYTDEWVSELKNKGEFYISLSEQKDNNFNTEKILDKLGIQGLMAAPIKYGERIVGLLGINNPKTNIKELTIIKTSAEFIVKELERGRLMEELEYVNYKDTLTGLKNRNQYTRLLKDYTNHAPDSLGVVFIDVNGMKEINDKNGHSFGDYVIKRVAYIMEENIEGNIFRIGGDQFVALCENVEKDDFQDKVLLLRKAFEADEDCDVSIGCVWKSGEMDIDSQILQADELMYAEKQSYYHSVLSEGRTARVGFASEVLNEIEEDRFVVYYQPQVEMKTGKIIGAEALVRKKDENGKLIAPDRFVPFYEVEGVIRHLDLHVLESACVAMRSWINKNYPIRVSVNFSRVTLMEPGIVNTIKGICDACKVPASYITVEVTESINKIDNEKLQNLVKELISSGFTISLDDFGSKYATLSVLSAIDFHEVKFDKTLIDDIENNPKSRIVIEHSIQMCKALKGTASIAEGIETKGQAELLMKYSCNYGQGYYFSRPICLKDFNKLLKENAENPQW